jgi:anti-sigma B factor antagonist
MEFSKRTVRGTLVMDMPSRMVNNVTGQLALEVVREIAAGHSAILLDLGAVTYIDSAGLGELIDVRAAAERHGGTVGLMNVTKRVNDLMVPCKLLTLFDVFDNQDEAISRLAS